MAVETKTDLNADSVSTLQDLIQVNIDSRDGFREAADEVGDERIATLFRQIGEVRERNASELQGLVALNDTEPQERGSIAAALHRTWLDLRAKLSGSDTAAVLSEAERGEDHIKAQYEEALKANPGSAVSDVLHRQLGEVKSHHDQVRDLRDAYKAGNTPR